MRIGETFKQARVEMFNVSQKAFGNMLDVSDGAISQIESGKRCPSKKLCNRFASLVADGCQESYDEWKGSLMVQWNTYHASSHYWH